MPSIDDRIVSLKFDNKTFEDRVASTIGKLDALKIALGFGGVKNSFKEIEDASAGVKFGGMTAALGTVSGRFTALGAIAFSVLQNITNRVVDAGLQLAKSFSIAPIIDGFREYETTINSVQTILSNTKSDNTTIDQVNTALKTLNDYSDKTIYNFGEMARNIGTFTAAGIDLDTSVASIKGIANLAAISGSSAQQAAGGMYQLSQAIATGTLRLVDWNSVGTAGMGGEVFQRALFETGKALGTLNDVPMKQTFEEWKDAGNTFRSSLEKDWVTADVLTTTLQGFTGDLTEAQVLALGYTKEQAAAVLELGQTGLEAATKVKTFTQLLGTIKETIGSGWAETFKLVLGDFAQASSTFTRINDIFGNLAKNSANTRNRVVGAWADLGGRQVLIEGLRNSFSALKQTLGAVTDAFREVFPRQTGQSLFEFTERFTAFTREMIPSLGTIEKIRTIFTGVFSAFRIGLEVVRGIGAAFKTLFDRYSGTAGKAAVDFLVNLAQKTTDLKNSVLESGTIVKFFVDLATSVGDFIDKTIKGDTLQSVIGFFTGLKEQAGDFSGASAKFQEFKDDIVRIVGNIADFIGGLGEDVLNGIKTLVENVKEGFQKYTFDDTFGTVNSGIFAVFTASLALSLRNAFKNFDYKGIGKGFQAVLSETVTTLQTLQGTLKADAIRNIAIAIALLGGSLLLLSLVNPEALARSIAALGFVGAQLVTFTAIFQRLGIDVLGATQFLIVATGMIALATAVTILSAAVTIMSKLSWEEIARGLAATATVMLVFAGVSNLFKSNGPTMILAGIAMSLFAVGLTLMAGAIKLFAAINTEDLAKGLGSIAVGLGVVAIALNAMSVFAPVKAAAVVILAASLYLIAAAIVLFNNLSWEDISKGLVGMGGGLVLVAGAMALMPGFMQAKAAALLVIAFAVKKMAEALVIMGQLSWGELARGLTGIYVGLIAIGVATSLMSGGLVGALAILVVSFALERLAEAIKAMAKVGFGTLAKGILVFAIAMGAIAIAAALMAPAIIPMLSFGAAIFLVGAGMALLGTGLIAVAAAIATFIGSIVGGIAVLGKYVGALLSFLLEFLKTFVKAMLFIVIEVGKALPEIIALLGKAIAALIKVLIENIPGFVEAVVLLISEVLKGIIKLAPEIVEAGFTILMELLRGIRDNIEEITQLAVDIVLKFLTALTERMPELVKKGAEFLVSLLKGLAANIGTVAAAAVTVIVEFLKGIEDGLDDIISAGARIVVKIITGIGAAASLIVSAGANALAQFLEGLVADIQLVIDAGWNFIIEFINGLAASIEDNMPKLRAAGLRLGLAIADGMSLGIAGKAKGLLDKVVDLGTDSVVKLNGVYKTKSPSRVTMGIGDNVVQGLILGLQGRKRELENASVALGETTRTSLMDTLNRIPDIIDAANIRPVITPVFDLSQAARDLAALNGKSTFGTFASSSSYDQASALNDIGSQYEMAGVASGGDIKFEQNNYSPKALTAGEIYRQTRTQLEMAKEALS